MGWRATLYTGTTTVTAPSELIYISGCAGGAGGGGGDSTPGGGGGGGCGGQAVNMYPLYCTLGETLTIAIGAGGAGGAAGANGSAGGNSSVVGSTSSSSLALYAGSGGAKGNGTAGGQGGSWVGGASVTGGVGGANGVAGAIGPPTATAGGTYQVPLAMAIAKFGPGAGGGGLNAAGGIGLSAKNGNAGNSNGGTGNANGGGGGGGGGTPWGAGGAGGSNGAAGAAPAAGQYGGGGGGGSGNSAGGGGSPGVLWLIWFDDADILNVLTSTLTLAGSIGKLIADNLNAPVSSRSTYDGSDTAGTTTLLARIVGTLATGTHNPQSGDAYARLGAPAGASVSADIATRLATSGYTAPDNASITAIKAKTDYLPADTNTLLTSTGIKIASIANGAIAAATFAANALDAVWSTATRTLTAISDSSGITTLLGRIVGTLASGTHQPQSGDAYARLGEQVPDGPVVVIPPPLPGQTTAWTVCYDEEGQVEAGVEITIICTKSTDGGAFDSTPVVLTSDEDGLASGPIPRGAGLTFTARRGSGRAVRFSGVDDETLELPPLVGAP